MDDPLDDDNANLVLRPQKLSFDQIVEHNPRATGSALEVSNS